MFGLYVLRLTGGVQVFCGNFLVARVRFSMGKRKLTETPVYLGTTDVSKAGRDLRLSVIGLCTLFIVDVLCSVALYFSLHSWHPRIRAKDLLHGLVDFHHEAIDLIILSVLRVAVLSFLAYLASKLAWKEGAIDKEVEALKKKTAAFLNGGSAHVASRVTLPGRAVRQGRVNGGSTYGDLNEPLLEQNQREVKKVKVAEPNEDALFGEWFSSIGMKDWIIFVCFLLCTVFQVYVGAKCVGFEFQRETEQGWLMGLAVLWINLESVLTSQVAEGSRILARAKRIDARKKAEARASSMHSSEEAAPILERVTVGRSSLVPTKSTLDPVAAAELLKEGKLRGDKGIREEEDVSQWSYLLRIFSLGLTREDWLVTLLGFLCLAVTSISNLVLPKYQGGILDRVNAMDKAGFQRDVTLMVIFSLVTGIFGGVRGLCFSVVGKRVLKTLQDRLFYGIIVQDIAYFDSTTSGELTSRLTNDVSSMAEPLNSMLSTLLRNLLALIGGFVMCFWTSWKLSMLAFTTMAPIMHITAIYSRWSRELNRKRYAVLAEANSAASEALGNIRTVRAFSTEHIEVNRYKNKTYSAMMKGVRDAFAYSGAIAINNWLDLGASVLILWYGGMLVMGKRLTIGRLITFQLYWGSIQSGYQSVMSVLMSLTRAAGAAQRVLSLVDALPDIDPDAGTKVSTLVGDIRLENVHFHYQMRPQHKVLEGVNLTINCGQVCALVGRSGGGKSTIVHLLMRFYDPSHGNILLDGWDMKELNLRSVHQHMGLVAQDTQMWSSSIEENITYGLTSYTQSDLEEAARYANAHDFIMKFPEGYATRVGERGVRLSGGQRQRIAIARMLLRRPRVLLLDEATSALDTESEALVQDALDRLIAEGGRTVILVAHRLSTVRNADMIAVMEKGRVVEQGTHDELILRTDGVYERLVRRQISKVANQISPEEYDAQGGDVIDTLIEECPANGRAG